MREYEQPPLPGVKEIETEPRNQWHQELLEQIDKEPVFVKIWNAPPKPKKAVYDWPHNTR